MSLPEKFKRVWNDPVGSQLITAGILAGITGLALFIKPVRDWAIGDLGNISRLQVLGWFGLGLVVGGIGCYLLLRSRFSVAQAQDSKLQQFREIIVEDRTLGLEWRIKRNPVEWADDHQVKSYGGGWRESVLAGPYHLAKGCGGQLKEVWDSAREGMVVESECPICHQSTFRLRITRLDELRLATLSELQRMHRNGKKLSGLIVLEKPEYWPILRPKVDSLSG
jgi:hypothetical protein